MAEDMLARCRALEGACACGRTHRMRTREIYIGEDWQAHLQAQAQALCGDGAVTVVADERTWEVAGRAAAQALRGREVQTVVLRGGELHANADSIGQVLLGVGDRTRLLVAVGSGTINDTTRVVAYRVGLPDLVVGTAPSMDGYASSVSPVLQDGMKITYEATHPEAVLSSPAILCSAPQNMVAAGLGDMLGKHTALLDWKLSAIATGESFCEGIAGMMREAVEICERNAEGLSRREGAAVSELTQGLVLSGLAMQMMGNSRPASGCEHHLSHFWEMRQLLRGQGASLHGDKVGVATLLIVEMYHRFFAKKPDRVIPVDLARWEARMRAAYGPLAEGFLARNPLDRAEATTAQEQLERILANWDALKAEADALYAKKDALRRMLEESGGPTAPAQVGCRGEDVRDALLCAWLLRPRFTLLKLAFDLGCLEEIVDEVLA